MTTIGLWAVLEGRVGLWCGYFPAMQPMLRQLLSSIGQSHLLTRMGYGGGGSSSSLGSTLRSGKHGGAQRVGSDADLARDIVARRGRGRVRRGQLRGRGEEAARGRR